MKSPMRGAAPFGHCSGASSKCAPTPAPVAPPLKYPDRDDSVSAGNVLAGDVASRSKSRTVLLYSTRVRRRKTPEPGASTPAPPAPVPPAVVGPPAPLVPVLPFDPPRWVPSAL